MTKKFFIRVSIILAAIAVSVCGASVIVQAPVPVQAASCSSNQAPRVVIGPDRAASMGEEINFDASGSSDADGDSLYYTWDFDSSNGVSVDQTGAKASYRWVKPGDYTVTLTARDACVSSSASARVSISDRLSLTLRPTVAQVSPGDRFGYTVNYANFTARSFEDIEITLDYDERYLSATDLAGGFIAAGVLIYRQPRLYQASSELRTFWFKVNESIPQGTITMSARAKLSGKEAAIVETGQVNISVSARVDLVGSMVLEEQSLRPGQTSKMTLGYRNRGNAVADNVSLEFHFDPQTFELTQVADGNTSARGVVTWQIGPLGADQKSTMELRLRVRETAREGKSDAWITLNAANASPYEQHTLVEVAGSPLYQTGAMTVTLTATDDDEFRVRAHHVNAGEYATFTVTLTNTTQSEIRDVLAHLDFSDKAFAIAELREAVDAGGALTWEIDRIEPAGTKVLTTRLRVLAAAVQGSSYATSLAVSGSGTAVQKAEVTTIIGGESRSTVSAAATAPRTGASPLPLTIIISGIAGIAAFIKYGLK